MLVADPTIVNTVLRTSRRVYVIGTALGETNVYLFDTDGRQIGALDIVVAPIPQPDPPPLLENSALPGQSVMVYRGVDDLRFYRCTPTCSSPPPPKSENADKPTNANSTTVVRDAQGIPTGTSTTSTSFTTGK